MVACGTPAEVAASKGPSAEFLLPLLVSAPAAQASGTKTAKKASKKAATKAAKELTAPAGARVAASELNAPIEIRGAREHNLKNLTVRLPREQLVVICNDAGSLTLCSFQRGKL